MPKLKNLSLVIRNLENGQTGDEIAKVYAEEIRDTAKRLSAVDTGENRDSIKSKKISDGVHNVTVNSEHGIYLEFGTSKMIAQPFFYPAIVKARESVKAVKTALKAIKGGK